MLSDLESMKSRQTLCPSQRNQCSLVVKNMFSE